MCKEHNAKNSKLNSKSKQQTPVGGEQSAPERSEPTTGENSSSPGQTNQKGASPSNTHPKSSHSLSDSSDNPPIEIVSDKHFKPVANIDWLETGGLVDWSGVNSELFYRLEQLKQSASESKRPEPYDLAGVPLFVQGRGLGSGHQSHLEYYFKFPAGFTLAVSLREGKSRGLANYYLKIDGSACVIHGIKEILDRVEAILKELGGSVFDEWVKRIDICLDLPEFKLNGWLTNSFNETRFVTSARTWNPWDGVDGVSGFTIGGGGRVRFNAYDKIMDVRKHHTEEYLLAMCKHRWHGREPAHATRLEFQIRKPWLDQYDGLKTRDGVMRSLPDIVNKLTNPNGKSFLRFTKSAVDRDNKHQSRSVTHPQWTEWMKAFQTGLGEPTASLTRVSRKQLNLEKAMSYIMTRIVVAGVRLGIPVQTFEDLFVVMHELKKRNFVTDGDVKAKWEVKLREADSLERRKKRREEGI